MGKLKTLKEKRATVYTQIDELRKAADGREMTAEEQTRWDDMLSDYEKVDKQVEQEERFQDVERRQAEQADEDRQNGKGDDNEEERYKKHFRQYLLNGNSVSEEARQFFEKRAGISGLASGVLVPTTLAGRIEVALKSCGGMLEASELIVTDNGGDLILPVINDTESYSTIVQEYNQSTKKAPSFGSITMKAYTYRTPIVPISMELLQDSAFDTESTIADLLVSSHQRGINKDFTNGNGTGKPKGIVTCATASDATPAANSIKHDDLIDLINSVDISYGRNGKFMFNQDTFWALAKIKDTTGRYIWQDSLRNDIPPTIFGKQYIINDDMQSIGAGNASVLFGDLKKYKIRMVRNFRVIRLNELLAEYLAIGIFGFARFDGNLLDAGTNPIKKLVHASA